MEIPNYKLRQIVKDFYEVQEENESVGWESAPSGEFNEYNYEKLELEGREQQLYCAIQVLGFEPYQLARVLGLEK